MGVLADAMQYFKRLRDVEKQEMYDGLPFCRYARKASRSYNHRYRFTVKPAPTLRGVIRDCGRTVPHLGPDSPFLLFLEVVAMIFLLFVY